MHLLGTFVGQHGFKIRHVAKHRVFQGNTITAQYRPGTTGNLKCCPHIGHLAHAYLYRIQPTGVLETAEPERQ